MKLSSAPNSTTVLYFALALAITWGLDLPALLAQHGVIAPRGAHMALVALGTFGPMCAGMIAARVERMGIGRLLQPLGAWRVGARWYLAAFGAPAIAFVLAAAGYNLAGHKEPLLYPPARPGMILGAVIFGLGEEIGWRGFALPRLRERYGLLVASAILGVLWSLWLLPLLVLQRASPILCIALFPGMLGYSVMSAWIFQRSGDSLFLAVLTYVGAHLNNPGHELPVRSTPFVIQMVAYTIFGMVLAVHLHHLQRGRATDETTAASRSEA